VTSPVLSTRVLNRSLLERQLLLERAERAIPETLEHLVGLQAQVPSSPYIALRARLAGFDPSALEQLYLDRRVVRMVLMRATIHLVTVDDALRLRPVVQPVLDWELFRNRTWSVGLEGVELEPVLALGRELVDERPRAMDELRAAMAERFPGRDAGTLAYAVRNQLPTFQAPPRGLWTRSGAVRLAAVDSWSGRPMSTETTPDATILRYLAAFGPASTSDAANWSRLTGLREPMERLRPRLRTFRDERGRELFDLPDAPIADPDVPAPVRFLPDYDNLLLGHDDRTRVIPAPVMVEVRQRIGGPTFLVDGFVAGFWRVARAGGASELTLEPLRPLTDPERDAVEAEAGTLLPFLDTAGPRRAPGREDMAERARVRWLA
jgi:hypothetical protein